MNLKTLLVAFVLLGQVAFAKDVLKYGFYAGFSPRPGSVNITVDDKGNVKYTSQYKKRGDTNVERTGFLIGKLSKAVTLKLIETAATIKAEDLKDLDAGKPVCMDAPTTDFAVMQGDNAISIGRHAGCHTWVNETQEGKLLKDVLDGQVALSRIKLKK